MDLQIDALDSGWTGESGKGLTVTHDTTTKKEGTSSLKIVTTKNTSHGALISKTLTNPVDISSYNEIHFWVKTDVTGRPSANAVTQVFNSSGYTVGSDTIAVDSTKKFAAGDNLILDGTDTPHYAVVDSIDSDTVTLPGGETIEQTALKLTSGITTALSDNDWVERSNYLLLLEISEDDSTYYLFPIYLQQAGQWEKIILETSNLSSSGLDAVKYIRFRVASAISAATIYLDDLTVVKDYPFSDVEIEFKSLIEGSVQTAFSASRTIHVHKRLPEEEVVSTIRYPSVVLARIDSSASLERQHNTWKQQFRGGGTTGISGSVLKGKAPRAEDLEYNFTLVTTKKGELEDLETAFLQYFDHHFLLTVNGASVRVRRNRPFFSQFQPKDRSGGAEFRVNYSYTVDGWIPAPKTFTTTQLVRQLNLDMYDGSDEDTATFSETVVYPPVT